LEVGVGVSDNVHGQLPTTSVYYYCFCLNLVFYLVVNHTLISSYHKVYKDFSSFRTGRQLPSISTYITLPTNVEVIMLDLVDYPVNYPQFVDIEAHRALVDYPQPNEGYVR